MPKRSTTKMKGLFQIFELSKNEQRVVLIVLLVLIAVAFVQYERRVHRPHVQSKFTSEQQSSPSPLETKNER